MSAAIRPATPGECDRLWPAVASGNVFDSREEFRAYHAEAPWRVRVTDKGEAAVLGAWRRHLDLLAMKGVWCSPRRVKAFVEDARGVARAQGFDGVISPLLPELFLEPYQRAGMRIVQRVVAMRGSAGCDALPSMPAGVHLRVGSPADAAGVHPGDRVVRVGARRIEHETVQVFRSITDGTAGPLQMALARNGTEIVVTVHRQPLVCIQRASARIDQKVWHERITEVRQLSGMIRSFLDNETAGFPEQRYPAAKDQLVKLFGLFGHLTKMLESELTDALTKECTFLTK